MEILVYELIDTAISVRHGRDSAAATIWQRVAYGDVVDHAISGNEAGFLEAFTKNIESQFLGRDGEPRFLQVVEEINFSEYLRSTPCETQEQCDRIAAQMEICSNLRSETTKFYEIIRNINLVLTTVMDLMCGCLFVGKLHFCILGNFSYTCKMPYQLYGRVVNLEDAVWDATRMITTICSFSTDPASALHFT